jgi:PKD repeat protein
MQDENLNIDPNQNGEQFVPPSNPVNPIEVVSSTTENVTGPTVETKQEKKQTKGPKRFFFAILAALGFISALLIFGLFLFLNTGENNPLFQALGVESGSISSFLSLVGVGLTGVISLVAFLGLVVSVFKFMNTKKEDKKAKKKSLILFTGSILVFALAFTGFIFAFKALNDPLVGTTVQESLIVTVPSETIGLTTPIEILFDGSQLPIDDSQYRIVSYSWNFGDGESATGSSVSHTYTTKPKDGIYTATLKVSYQDISNPTSEILEETFTKVIAIANQSVFVTFTASPDSGPAPLEVRFDGSESFDPDGQIVNYEWDFNEDGIYDAEGDVAEYEFIEPGAISVKLRITDNNGEYSSAENIINVKSDETIKAVISNTPEDEVLVPQRSYQFDASDSISDEGTITSYEWNFGDGSPKVGRKVTHTYDNEGLYTITLKLTDDAGNVRSYERDYTVSASASGLFARIQSTPTSNASGDIVGLAPLRLNLDAGGSSGGDIVDFQWDFDGDGQFDDSGQTVDHVYTSPGEYDLQLKIISSDDKTAISTVKVIVESPGLQAKVTATPTNGQVPLDVTFDASATRVPEDKDVVTFRWNFGDGTPLKREGSRVTHRYNKIGIFTAKVEAITSDNDISEATITIHVNSIPLQSCYKMSREQGPAPLVVIFDPSCSTGTVQSYKWNFGDDTVSNERRPIHTFAEPGTYEVDLEVVDSDNGVSHFVDTVTVE